jgi:fermentation-respiration switch protein FrsA (DUF1100 family)
MFSRTIRFSSDGLALTGELVVPDDPAVMAVLCHGIPSGKPPEPGDEGYAGFARRLAARGQAAFWFNFRGVRGAPGEFSIGGWTSDLAHALDALEDDAEVGAIPRVLVGSSAGGAVAITVGAGRQDVVAVAALATPASFTFGGLIEDPQKLLAMFRNIGIVHDPAFPADVDAWWKEFLGATPEDRVAEIAPRPLLLVHGDSDDVVAYPHAERLFAAAAEPKELARIPAGGHQLRRDPRALDALVDWIQNLPI